MGKFHNMAFPNETQEYRDARDELLTLELGVRQAIERMAKLRRELPLGGKVRGDYYFDELDRDGQVTQVQLSQLFERSESLIVYGFMYGASWQRPCASCTSIMDAANAQAPDLAAAGANLVVVAKAPIEKLAGFARERGWTHLRLLSSGRSSFNEDYYAELDTGTSQHHPMINVFRRVDDQIHHFWASETYFVGRGGHPRHADLLWPLWNWLDLTPEGRGNFMPRLSYE